MSWAFFRFGLLGACLATISGCKTDQEKLVGTFGELLEALEADGVDFGSAEYDRIELDPGSGTSIIGGGDVHFRCKDRRLYVSVSWTDSGEGPAVVGLSRWYKTVD